MALIKIILNYFNMDQQQQQRLKQIQERNVNIDIKTAVNEVKDSIEDLKKTTLKTKVVSYPKAPDKAVQDVKVLNQKEVKFPVVQKVEITNQKEVNIPKVEFPKVQKVEVVNQPDYKPEINVNVPEIKIPEIKVPQQKVNFPDSIKVSNLNDLKLPKVEMPDIEFKLPKQMDVFVKNKELDESIPVRLVSKDEKRFIEGIGGVFEKVIRAGGGLSNNDSERLEMMKKGMAGFRIDTYDYIALTYDESGNLETVTYKDGGSSGNHRATLTLAYDESGNLTSVTRT